MSRTLQRDPKQKYTYADYCSWPDDERWELIDGVPYDMTPAPSRLHADLSIALLRQLLPYFDGKTCKVYDAPFDVRLPKSQEADDRVNSVVQPDILIICDPQKLDDKGCRGAPDLVIEIPSPSTASKDHIKKRRLYEKHGVKEYWLLSPTDRILTVYHLVGKSLFGKPDVFDDTDVVEVKLFPGLTINLAKVFPPLPKIVRQSPPRYQ